MKSPEQVFKEIKNTKWSERIQCLENKEMISSIIQKIEDYKERRRFMRELCELTGCVFYTTPLLAEGFDEWDYFPMLEESGVKDVIEGGCALLMATDEFLEKANFKRWKMLKNLNHVSALLGVNRDIMCLDGELNPKKSLEVIK